MNRADFREFLRLRDEPEVDWEGRRSAWLGDLERLYDMVAGWLAAYQDDGVTCERVPSTLEEEYLGRYEVDRLRIRLRGLEARLEPVGANIIGAAGRVDLIGFAGEARLLLLPESVDQPRVRTANGVEPGEHHVWKLATPAPDVRYLNLTEDCFLDLLRQVVDG